MIRRFADRVRRSPWTGRVRIGAAVALVSIAGVLLGVMLLAQTHVNVGPFHAEMSISPSLRGGTEVNIPPLGSLHLDSHDGPIHLKVDLGSLDQTRTEQLIDDPSALGSAGERAVDDVTGGVLRLGLRAMGAAVAAALLLSALVFRNLRRVAGAGVVALVVTGGSLGLAAGTLRPQSISEPRYEGLLVNAPAVVGDARKIADNYGRYADQLSQLVTNVSRIYTTVSNLPVYEPAGNTTRILHVSDLHLNPSSWGLIRTVIKQWDIDAVVDTGDMVDWGTPAEEQYVANISTIDVPYIYVRGNHDSAAIQAAVGREKNAIVLDDSTTTINGLTIAGIGDPLFTPDKTTVPDTGNDDVPNPLTEAGDRLADLIRASPRKVDVAMVHEPPMAAPLAGVVPLVLAGHLHKRVVSELPAPSPSPGPSPSPTASGPAGPVVPSTRLMVEGSTGGAGLRGLENDQATPLALSVLYFDENQQLKAYDDISLGGTGQSNVTVQRKVIGQDDGSGQISAEVTPTPSPSPSPS